MTNGELPIGSSCGTQYRESWPLKSESCPSIFMCSRQQASRTFGRVLSPSSGRFNDHRCRACAANIGQKRRRCPWARTASFIATRALRCHLSWHPRQIRSKSLKMSGMENLCCRSVFIHWEPLPSPLKKMKLTRFCRASAIRMITGTM